MIRPRFWTHCKRHSFRPRAKTFVRFSANTPESGTSCVQRLRTSTTTFSVFQHECLTGLRSVSVVVIEDGGQPMVLTSSSRRRDAHLLSEHTGLFRPYRESLWFRLQRSGTSEASRRGFTEALPQVVLGDGATWIWNTATELFPPATQILDRFHAKEHLGEVGKVIHGDSPEGKAWIDARCEELDEGHLKSLVHALRSHIGQHKEVRECIQYIWRNRRRMRYPQFEKQGFCTSTGVVESGCKIVVGTRLKRAGMHWTVKGANAIIALRCSKLSGRFPDFWERRSERKQVAA